MPQGTAAEIVKQGMINVDRALREANLGACMLLQIHDELLLSVPANEIEKTEQLVKETLESIVSWNIPLTVNICRGNNWKEVTK